MGWAELEGRRLGLEVGEAFVGVVEDRAVGIAAIGVGWNIEAVVHMVGHLGVDLVFEAHSGCMAVVGKIVYMIGGDMGPLVGSWD